MTLQQNERVRFYDFGHKYILDGKDFLIGVTELMAKHGLSADYRGINEKKLNHAANLGTQAHNAIEAYCDGLPVVETPLIKSFKKLGLKPVCCEYLVSDNALVASKIDLVVETGERSVAILDIKRTSTVHKEALAWQLGIYKVFFEAQNPGVTVDGCYCLPIKKGNKDDIEADTCKALVQIEPVSAEQVQALLACEARGEKYTADAAKVPSIETAIGFGSVALMKDLVKRVQEYDTALKAAQEQLSAFKSTLYQWMLENNVDEMCSGDVTVKLKRPSERETVDTKKLKSKYPEIAEELTKVTVVSGNVTITLN